MMKDKYGAKVTEDSVQVWRALKSLTGGISEEGDREREE